MFACLAWVVLLATPISATPGAVITGPSDLFFAPGESKTCTYTLHSDQAGSYDLSATTSDISGTPGWSAGTPSPSSLSFPGAGDKTFTVTYTAPSPGPSEGMCDVAATGTTGPSAIYSAHLTVSLHLVPEFAAIPVALSCGLSGLLLIKRRLRRGKH